MEINKQLFEDVLSGKLKGTFVLLGNNTKVNSKELKRNNSFYSSTHPYRLLGATYNFKGKVSLYDYEMLDDIIDFIPDTDMKENELTIEIPDGKIVDWEESKKQNKIVLKNEQLTYENICKKLFEDNVCYTDVHGNIKSGIINCVADPNNALTKHQLECILAKNQLATVAKYLNAGWKPKELETIYYITAHSSDIEDICECTYGQSYMYGRIIFKSRKLAQQAIEILGEKTIKLALEPLGI